MSQYAQIPGSDLILPVDLAKSVTAELMFGNSGAYRTASMSNRNTAGWVTSDGSADVDTLADIPMLRRQSRDLIRNDALPAGIISANVTAVVGTGIVPQSRIDYEFLGISEEEAAKFQADAERIFYALADKKHWDAEGRENFWQQQSTVQRAIKESGDTFVVRRYIERPGKPLGFAAQLVEGDRVYTPLRRMADKNIRAGLEVDDYGALKRVHIAQQHPGERYQNQGLVEVFTEVDAFDGNGDPLILPIIPRLRPGQTRGVPYLAPVIEMFKQLSRYTEAEIAAAVISGMLAVMVKSPLPQGPLPSAIPGMVQGRQMTPKGGQMTRLQSGMIVDLAPGEEIQVVDTTRPNPVFDSFVQALLRQIGAALEVPFEVLIKHFTASYSAARAAIMEAWRFYFKERDFLVHSYCQPSWEWVISEAVAAGKLKADGFWDDPLKRAAWLGCDWIGQGAPQIDPEKDANAAVTWNSLGVWSLQDISAQQGKDWDRVMRQLVRERKAREEAGLALPLQMQASVALPNNGGNAPKKKSTPAREPSSPGGDPANALQRARASRAAASR